MAAPLQPLDLLAQHERIAAVPAVRDEQHDRAAVERAARPPLMELPQRVADAGAPGPAGRGTATTSATASLSLRARSSLVTRVSAVEKTNTSTRRCRRPIAWAKCRSMRE